ncbi:MULTISPECIES: hypothetical protein [Streptomyces]|uniref:Uncharacterized protein n=1 Tax=Streptomyces chengmaiensis TaxID=3040919 RepID=A0ABT6HSU9_9ACTN|nr:MULTISPECIES: hypothetical protein [Streptomyces]MDH2391792.1 hypothetical protein [Streptomyces chengmaiensis]WRQ81808.1 hypothetical protein I3F59_021965 [Streptomyces sp. MUM 178J]
MSSEHPHVLAEITSEARSRCVAVGGRALEAVEALRAELEKNPELGRRATSAAGRMKLYTTRLEGNAERPALTVTYVYDAPPPEPGIIRIALVSPVHFAGGDGEF